MTLDERLRSQLDDAVERPQLDIEASLADAIVRGRRRRAGGMVAVAGSLVVVVVAVALVLRAGLPFGDDVAPARPDAAVPFSGDYSATVSTAEPEVQMLSLAGDYEMSISDDGVIEISGPPDFERRWTSPAGPIEVDGDRVRVFLNQSHCT